MNTKHTQGPWKAHISREPNGQLNWIPSVYAPNGNDGCKSVCELFNNGQMDANARLIAAAPELLEALNALVAWMDASELSKTKPGGVGAFRYEGHEYSVVTQARSAIARATGE